VAHQHRDSKDLQEMNNNHSNLLKHLKPLVVNQQEWDQFNNYIKDLIKQQHRTMEQTEDSTIVFRSQGAIHTLRRLLLLREEVLKNA
jgi:predicted transcriptional regulator